MNTNTMPSITLRDYWELAVRRRWLILGSTVIAFLIAGLLCLVLPKSYRSSTLVLVESQKIPEDYVKGIVGGSIEERLTMIQQQVMSRTLLNKVIDEFKLYEDSIRKHGMDTTLEEMRKNIKVETVGTVGARGRSVEAFSISFGHEDPMTAMKVTAKLASQFIEENLRVREQLVEGASEFLEQELARSKMELEIQEKAISEFKKQHIGALPEQTELNLRAMDRLQIDLTAAGEMEQSLTDRLKMIEKAIEDYESSGVVAPGAPAGGGGPVMDPLVARLHELERNLATLMSEYKDTYPDIALTKKELVRVKEQLAERKRELGLDGKDADAAAITGKTFDPYLLGLVRQREDAKIELNTMKQRRQRITEQIQDYENRIRQAPAREQALMTLVRDYENQRNNYKSLLDKRLTARVAESLEKRQKGEQFRVIDPANLPERPEKPDRLRILLMGLALGCGLGFGAAVVMEQMNPAFRRPVEAEFLLGIPLLAAIPSFSTLLAKQAAALPFGSAPARTGNGMSYLPAPEGGDHAGQNGNGNGGGGLPAESNGSQRLWSRLLNGREWLGEENILTDGLVGELNLVTKWSPLSVVAEQYRVAATRLALMSAERRNSVVIVTSAVKGEGKTSSAANLAYTLARDLGKVTLLIDCDCKRPTVHSYMGTSAEPGLAEVLHETHPVRSCLQAIGEWPLWVLPAGNQKNYSVALARMSQLATILNYLRSDFDYIILDAPPILPLADMNVLAGMADILALVIRAEFTSRDVVQTALNTLKPSIPMGLILTGLKPSGIPYYMQQSYYLHAPERTARRAS